MRRAGTLYIRVIEKPMTDRRRETRHEVVLPITIGSTHGTTRDVSTTGVYFDSAVLFDAGAEIEFSLPLANFMAAGVELNCRGTIVRVDAIGNRCGVAARIDQLTVHPRSHKFQIQ